MSRLSRTPGTTIGAVYFSFSAARHRGPLRGNENKRAADERPAGKSDAKSSSSFNKNNIMTAVAHMLEKIEFGGAR